VGQPLYSRPEAPVFDRAVVWDDPVVTAANAKLTFVHRRGDNGGTWTLTAQSLKDGGKLWERPLAAEPVRWGLAVDVGSRIVVTLRNGQVLCFGQ